MTISVRSRISVTTPDGRTHTGVVTGLRGQGMADLLLDDGRAIRQPVSALRPVLARTNGRHARLNPRARRNAGDVYDQAAAVLVDPSRAKTVKVAAADGSTDSGTTVYDLMAAIRSSLWSRVSLGRAAAWANGADVRADEIAEALRVYGPLLSGSFSYYLSEPRFFIRSDYTSQDPDAVRDYLLLYALRDVVSTPPPVAAEMQPGALYAEVARLLLDKEALPAVSVVSSDGKATRRGFNDGELEALTGKRIPPAAYVKLIKERLFQDFAGPDSAVYRRPQPVLDDLLTAEEIAAEAAAEDRLRRASDKLRDAKTRADQDAADKERKEAADKLSKLRTSYEKMESDRRNARFEEAKRGRVRVDGQPDTPEALAASLQAALRERLPVKTTEALIYADPAIKDLPGVSKADARKLFLLATLHSLVELSARSPSKPPSAPSAPPPEEYEEEDKPLRRPAKKLTPEDQERREKGKLQAETIRGGRHEDRTAARRLHRERTRQLGGVDLKTFTDTEQAAYRIIRDPLRVTRDNKHLCGNALDGYAYTVATTTQKRTVRHWLTWRDLGITETRATTPLFTALLAARRGEKPVSTELTLKDLSALLEMEGALGVAYGSVGVVLTQGTDKDRNKLTLTRTPVSRFLAESGAYNEFEVNVVHDVPPAVIGDMLKGSGASQPQFAVVDIQPALQRVRAGSQTGSLYPRRPMPPESPTPGQFNPDAPVLLTPSSGFYGAPDVFGFSVVREVETATALLDKFKPYPGYSFKDRNPYFSWQPEAPGQFSAMMNKTGARPCANPEMVAQLNALRKTYYTINALVKAATRLNAALTKDDGINTVALTKDDGSNTIEGERAQDSILRSVENVTGALVRVVRLQQAIAEQKYIKGSRIESTSDFSVFTSPGELLAAVAPVTYAGQKAEESAKDEEGLKQLRGVIPQAKAITKRLSEEALKLAFVRETSAPVESDPDRVIIEPGEVRKQMDTLARRAAKQVNVSVVHGLQLYTVIPELANVSRAPFALVTGALCAGARLVDVVASLVPSLDQLNVLNVPDTGMSKALSQATDVPDTILQDLLLARQAPYAVGPTQRGRLMSWWTGVRQRLAGAYGPAKFNARTPRGRKALSDKFLGLLDFLIAREQAALSGGSVWDAWDGKTSPVAAFTLGFYASTFLGDPKLGGLLGSSPRPTGARTNAGRGSTETDDMVKRAAQSGYIPQEPLTDEQQKKHDEARLRLRGMTRADKRPLSYDVGRESEEAAALVLAARAKRAAEAAAENEAVAVESIAQGLQRSLEFAQRNLVGGGRVAETEKGVKLHYTYNPLLFQLLRLYYHQDREQKGQEPVPVPAAPPATPNPAPKRARDIYTEMAEALALAADGRLTDISLFASSIPVLPPPPMLRTAQLVTRIVERMRKHPKSYQKSLSRLAGKQIPLVQVINELQKTLPRAQDLLRYYRSRIEGAAAEGKVTGDANADQKALLLFAVYQALSDPPGTPAREEYTEAHFSAEAPIPKPQVTVTPQRQRPPPAPRPESPLLQAKRGDVFMMPEQAQNMFMGFSQAKEGKDKKPVHVIINEPMLRMIDWVGVYGSLLDLVRRAMLAFKRENLYAAQNWDQVHEGWVKLFVSQVMNGTMKDIPQMWLDLCPIDETPKSWALRYRALREDESGEAIKDTVLWAKDYAARGLTYAGALARRGFDPAGPAHKSLGVPAKPGEDLFVRRVVEAEGDTIQALRALLKDTAKELQKAATEAGDAKHAALWKDIAAQGFSALGQKPITSNLIYLSLKPLQHAKLLSSEQVAQLREALLETAANGEQKFRQTIRVPHALFKAYVAAVMRLRGPKSGASTSPVVATQGVEDLLVRRPVEEESDTIRALRKLLEDTAKGLQKTAADAGETKHAEHWKGIATQDFTALGQEPITSSLIYLSLRPLQHAHLLTDEQAQQLNGALFEMAADGERRFRGTISVPSELFKAYVAAVMRLHLQTKELNAPQYLTAPTSRSVQLIRATAADDTHEPADSFIGISLDREDMRKLLLTLVDKKREALSVQIAKAAKDERERKSKTAPP